MKQPWPKSPPLFTDCYLDPVQQLVQTTRPYMQNHLTPISRIHALQLLTKIDPDEIWSIQDCVAARIPNDWIEHFRDTYESNFDDAASTIEQDGKRQNQYHGIRAIDLAVQASVCLGIRLPPHTLASNHRRAILQAIHDAIEES